MSYRTELIPPARAEIRAFPGHLRAQVLELVAGLGLEPRPPRAKRLGLPPSGTLFRLPPSGGTNRAPGTGDRLGYGEHIEPGKRPRIEPQAQHLDPRRRQEGAAAALAREDARIAASGFEPLAGAGRTVAHKRFADLPLRGQRTEGELRTAPLTGRLPADCFAGHFGAEGAPRTFDEDF